MKRASIPRHLIPPELLAQLGAKPAKPSKYRNKKTTVDGEVFDSKREAERFCLLKAIQQAGAIRDLRRQRTYHLVVNGIKVCSYKADFIYVDVATGQEIVEDSKGFRTKEYRLKRKLMLACLGITIKET